MHSRTEFVFKDYSWEDHGYSLVNRLYPDVGQLIDEKFQIAYNLTYNTMAMHKDVDTSMLRRAIWNYIHCMFGIRLVLLCVYGQLYGNAVHLFVMLDIVDILSLVYITCKEYFAKLASKVMLSQAAAVMDTLIG